MIFRFQPLNLSLPCDLPGFKLCFFKPVELCPLHVVKQEREMLQRDLQAKLAEHRRMSAQNEEWSKAGRCTLTPPDP